MTPTERRRAFRDGLVFQGFAAPHLFAPIPGLTGVEAQRYAYLQTTLTTVKTTPRFDEAGHKAFREALGK